MIVNIDLGINHTGGRYPESMVTDMSPVTALSHTGGWCHKDSTSFVTWRLQRNLANPAEPGESSGTWRNLAEPGLGEWTTFNVELFSAVHHCRSLTSTAVRRGGCSTEQRRTRRNNTSKELSLRFIAYSFDQRLSIALEFLSP